MTINAEDKLSLKFMLLFIPVAYISYLFHEFGHWIIGEVLGNNMVYSLNYVWPQSGYFIDVSHALYSSIGGPAFTILLSLFFLLIIEKYKTMYAYPFVFFQMFCRFFALVFGGFGQQDEAKNIRNSRNWNIYCCNNCTFNIIPDSIESKLFTKNKFAEK
jgi:hypothetical protein